MSAQSDRRAGRLGVPGAELGTQRPAHGHQRVPDFARVGRDAAFCDALFVAGWCGSDVPGQNSSASPGLIANTLVDVLPSALMYSSGVPDKAGVVP